ncbi:MAG: PIN domain-containing protein [Bryobacteraceae bacterium]
MNAVDTNVVVRFLTEDDPHQYAAARRIFATGPIWVSKTVLLETAWVLSSTYRRDELSIRDFLLQLLGLPFYRTSISKTNPRSPPLLRWSGTDSISPTRYI